MSTDDLFIIQGIKDDGSRLRPENWVERISSTLASYGADHRLRYNKSVHPCVVGGEKCLVVARDLANTDPEAFLFIMNFAEQNSLQILVDRRYDERALISPIPVLEP